MKRLLYIMIVTITISSLGSCRKNFLETNPMQSTAADMAITNLAGARAAGNGLYGMLQSAGLYGRTFPVIADLMADNIYLSRRNSNRYQTYDQYTVTITDSYASGLWSQLYAVIVNANILIAKANSISFPASDQPEADHLVGEAYTLRAMAHFDLVRLFSQPYNYSAGATHPGVPVITNGDYGQVIEPARNTVKEVYDQVIADLKKSIELLPATPVGFAASFKGKVTLNAAKALLARVYLYKEDWANAEAMATEVIDSKKYTLLANNGYVANSRLQNNTETIFEVQYTATDNLGSDAMVNFSKQGGSYGDALATENLYNIYTAADVRRGLLLMGKRSGSGGEDPAVQITKFDNTSTYLEGIKIIRLAEVYLIRAEARARQGGKDALAIADLDVIRKRADAAAAVTTATGNDLINLVLLERRKELFLEGHRLFDLTRNKLSFTKYRTGGLEIPVVNTSLKTILPIPSSEMNNNKKMEQNEGYK